MPFDAVCPHCQSRYVKVPEKYAGNAFNCKRCHRSFELRPPKVQPAMRRTTVHAPPSVAPTATPHELGTKLPPEQSPTPPPKREGISAKPSPATVMEPVASAPQADPGKTQMVIPDEPPAADLPPLPTKKAVVSTPTKAIPDAEPEAVGTVEWDVGDVILNLYEVSGILGKGGMGTVYKVRHKLWNVELAVKSPLPQLLAVKGGAENFEREAETWVNLGLNPHNVSCYYVRRVDGVPRLFAEFVEGGNLSEWTRDRKFTGIGQMLDLAIQFAWGLHYAHEQGLVHQDVKPANVMVTTNGVAKVTDYGLAKARESTGSTAPAGSGPVQLGGEDTVLVSSGGMTLAYCSPEQAARKPLSRRTDIWSWGVSVLEMFTGKATWKLGVKAPQELDKYLETGPVGGGLPPMPESLVALLRECWHEDPSERPRDMLAVTDAVAAIYQEVTGEDYLRWRPVAGRDTPDSLNNRGVSLLDLGRNDEAVKLWTEAQSRDPNHLEAAYNQALHAWKRGELTDVEILHRMDEVVQSQKDPARANHLLGRIHIALANYDKAMAHLSKVRAANPSNAEGPKDAGIAECAFALQGDYVDSWESACSKLQEALDLGHRDAQVTTGYALALHKLGSEREAETFYRDVQETTHDLPTKLTDAVSLFIPGSETVRTLRKFRGPVQAGCLSGDGQLAVAVDADDAVRCWDMNSGELLSGLHEKAPDTRALALSADSRFVFIASADQPIEIREIQTGRRLRRFQHFERNLECLAVSYDGKFVAAGYRNSRLRLFDTETAKPIHELQGHVKSVTSVVFSADGRYLLSGSLDRTARLWESSSGSCVRVLSGHSAAVLDAAFGPDQRTAICASEDGTVQLWELEGSSLVRSLRGPADRVIAVKLSSDNRRGLVVSADGSLRRWDLATGEQSIVMRFKMPMEQLQATSDCSLALISTSIELATGASLYLVRPFTRHPYTLPYAISVPSSAVEVEENATKFRRKLDQAGAFTNERKFDAALAALEEARSVSGFERSQEALDLWRELARHLSRKELREAWELETIEEHGGEITAVATTGDAGKVLIGRSDGSLGRRDLVSGERVQARSMHNKAVTCVAPLPDGKRVVSAGLDTNIFVWVAETGEHLQGYPGHDEGVTAVAALPDGQHMLSASLDKTLRLWDLESEQAVRIFKGHSAGVLSCAVSPDGCFAISGGWDNTVRLWDLSAGKELFLFEEHSSPVRCVAISPDGTHALSASGDRTVRYWDLSSRKSVLTLADHGDEVTSVAFSPDGRFAASASKDAVVRLWNLWNLNPKLNRLVRSFEGHTAPVSSLGWYSDGSSIVSGGTDKTLRLWYLDWELAFRKESDWDDRLLPFLEVFLSRHMSVSAEGSRGAGKRPTASDIESLVSELKLRGYGWIGIEAVKRKLREMVPKWSGATSTWRQITDSEKPKRATPPERRKVSPQASTQSGIRSAWSRYWKLMLLASPILLIVILNRLLFPPPTAAITSFYSYLEEGDYEGAARYISPGILEHAVRLEQTLSEKKKLIEEKGGIASIEFDNVEQGQSEQYRAVTITTEYGNGSTETKLLVIVQESYGDWLIQNHLSDLD